MLRAAIRNAAAPCGRVVQRRWCGGAAGAQSPVSAFESRLTVFAKKNDWGGMGRTMKEMHDQGIEPTPRVYLILLQLYVDTYGADADMAKEGATMTFEKAHARGFTKQHPALWTLMMVINAKARDAAAARSLDHQREGCKVPVPQGSLYVDSLKAAIGGEWGANRKALPPGLRGERDFAREHHRNTLEMERERA
eukprot:TRINITY_DN12598_c0_g1_i1.p2 TRINITY_DN12598_c0_g1~~TRINITY_DN12598_c0_g1_i1.p2  ORF type:complete len:194 (+),score=66.04 TRINITY_DN12598_c0_g1_i1:59-640(+)